MPIITFYKVTIKRNILYIDNFLQVDTTMNKRILNALKIIAGILGIAIAVIAYSHYTKPKARTNKRQMSGEHTTKAKNLETGENTSKVITDDENFRKEFNSWQVKLSTIPSNTSNGISVNESNYVFSDINYSNGKKSAYRQIISKDGNIIGADTISQIAAKRKKSQVLPEKKYQNYIVFLEPNKQGQHDLILRDVKNSKRRNGKIVSYKDIIIKDAQSDGNFEIRLSSNHNSKVHWAQYSEIYELSDIILLISNRDGTILINLENESGRYIDANEIESIFKSDFANIFFIIDKIKNKGEKLFSIDINQPSDAVKTKYNKFYSQNYKDYLKVIRGNNTINVLFKTQGGARQITGEEKLILEVYRINGEHLGTKKFENIDTNWLNSDLIYDKKNNRILTLVRHNVNNEIFYKIYSFDSDASKNYNFFK